MPPLRSSRNSTSRYLPFEIPAIASTAPVENALSLMGPAPVYDHAFPNYGMIPQPVMQASGTPMTPFDPSLGALDASQGFFYSATTAFVPPSLPVTSPAFNAGYNPHVSFTGGPAFSLPQLPAASHSAPVQVAPVAVEIPNDEPTRVTCTVCSEVVISSGMTRHCKRSKRHRRALEANNALQGEFQCEACFRCYTRLDTVARHYYQCDAYINWIVPLIISGSASASDSPASTGTESTASTSSVGSPASGMAGPIPSPCHFTPEQLDVIVQVLQDSLPTTPLTTGPNTGTISYVQPAPASLPPLAPAGEQLLQSLFLDLAAPVGDLHLKPIFSNQHAALNDIPSMIAGLRILARTPGFERCEAVPAGAEIIAKRLKEEKGEIGISAHQRGKVMKHAALIYDRAQQYWLRLRASA